MRNFTLFIFLSFLITSTQVKSQTFEQVVTDPEDGIAFVKDIKGVFYALDDVQDSLWLRLTFYDTTGGDFGVALAFDTNLVTTDGNTWGGSNSSMNYDLIIYLERNGSFEDTLRSSSLLAKNIVEGDSMVTINFQWSQIAPQGSLNLLTGAGFFDISSTGTVYDDAPDTGYVTLPLVSSTIETHSSANAWKIYPNPAGNYFKVSLPGESVSKNLKIRLLSIDGKVVRQWNTYANRDIDLSGVNRGFYILVIENGSGTLVNSQLQVVR